MRYFIALMLFSNAAFGLEFYKCSKDITMSSTHGVANSFNGYETWLYDEDKGFCEFNLTTKKCRTIMKGVSTFEHFVQAIFWSDEYPDEFESILFDKRQNIITKTVKQQDFVMSMVLNCKETNLQSLLAETASVRLYYVFDKEKYQAKDVLSPGFSLKECKKAIPLIEKQVRDNLLDANGMYEGMRFKGVQCE